MVREKRTIRVSRKAAIFVGILVVLGIAAWAIFMRPRVKIYEMGITQNVVAPQEAGMGSARITSPGYPAPYYGDNPSAKDTREFMKVYYNSEIKTRDVKDMTRDVKGIIRDADGRIDNLTETPKYAYVNFVVPKSKFENFREEIESLAHEKLIDINTSSSNLLGQKQYIEEQEQSAETALAELEKELLELNASHAVTVKTLQNNINANAVELLRVRNSIAATSDPARLSTLKAEEATLVKYGDTLNQSLNSENQSFNARSQSIKSQIADTKKMLENIAEQDEDFTDNIETVSGSISVRWVSAWQLMKIFSPIHPIWEIIIILLVLGYLLKRKNYLPGIEFV